MGRLMLRDCTHSQPNAPVQHASPVLGAASLSPHRVQVPCIFGTPGVAPRESAATDRLWDGVFWLFQCVGASFFIVSAWLFMLEEQPAWWRPQPQRAGWHVGAWNLVGSVGFWLSGFFGFWAVPAGIMQVGGTAGSTFWGSYAFLIGSYIQLLEVLNKHPERIKWTCW